MRKSPNGVEQQAHAQCVELLIELITALRAQKVCLLCRAKPLRGVQRAQPWLRDSQGGYSYQDSITLKLFDGTQLSNQHFKLCQLRLNESPLLTFCICHS